MIKENKSEFDILGITRWHDLGIKGEGIKIGNLESTYTAYFLKDQLRSTFDYTLGKSTNTHGQKTMDCINQAAPLAELFSLSNATDKIVNDSLPFILRNNIHLVSASLTSTNNDTKDKLIKQCIDNGTIFTAAAGNIGDKGIKGYPKNPLFLAVVAVHYNEELKKIYRPDYSSKGPEAFVSCFSNLWLRNAETKEKLIPSQQGTSFSNPLFVGMLALVQEFFIKSTGKALSQEEMKLFVMDNTLDLGGVGHDEEYGYGLFTLPEPSTIDLSKYYLDNGPIIIETPVKEPKEEDKMARFTDIKKHWAEGAIEFVADKGLMKGYEEGQSGPADDTFRPDSPVTRAELATVLARQNGYVEKK